MSSSDIADAIRSDVECGCYLGGAVGAVGLGEFRAAAPIELDEHGHGELHICFVLDGAMWERVGRRERRLEAGDVRISPPGDRHRIRFGEDGCRCFLVFVPDALLEHPAHAVLERPRFLHAPALQPAAQRLLAQLRDADAASPLIAEASALEIVAQTTRAWREEVVGGPPVWLRDAAAALEASPASPPDLATVAARAGVHRVHLARAFRSHFGCSPGEYARRLRLERAWRLITATDLPLSAIAYRCGFADQSHMSRLIRRAFARTPGALRRDARRTRGSG